MTRQVRIAPSLLAADFARLGPAVEATRPGADWAHVDVMDGHFVPNITLGPPVFASLRAATDIPLDVHLMVSDPATWGPWFAEHGAQSVTVHHEAAAPHGALATQIKERGARAGLAVKPGTPFSEVTPHLADWDMLLVMTVEPGFGGQSFLADQLAKVREARAWLDDHGLDLWLQVDGGVSLSTIESCAEAGADMFVAGSAVYRADDPSAMCEALRAAAKASV